MTAYRCPLCDAQVTPKAGSPTPGPNAIVTCIRRSVPHSALEERGVAHLIVDPDLGATA